MFDMHGSGNQFSASHDYANDSRPLVLCYSDSCELTIVPGAMANLQRPERLCRRAEDVCPEVKLFLRGAEDFPILDMIKFVVEFVCVGTNCGSGGETNGSNNLDSDGPTTAITELQSIVRGWRAVQQSLLIDGIVESPG